MSSLAPDDAVLPPALARLGVEGVVAGWEDPHVDWERFALVILRSCWNYHLKPLAFIRWLDSLATAGVSVLNTVEVVKRNMSKTYLAELARLGFSIPPTVWVDAEDSRTLMQILTQERWAEAVIKPTISASAFATFRVTRENASSHETEFLQLRRQRAVMVQKFVPAVIEHGELSFVFLGSRYSHAVLKTARAGDFRVQSDFGGMRSIAAPSAELIRQACLIFKAAAPGAAYARIDAIDVQGTLLIMEVELIDPVLFFGFSPGSEANLAQSIAAALG